MGKTFNTLSKTSKVKEPLFQLGRARYRGSRSSEFENLESNLIKIDLTRINSQLDSIDQSILTSLQVLVGDKNDISLETNLNDGLSTELEGIDIKFDEHPIENDIEIDSLDKISGNMSRLFSKLARLEKGV